MVSSNDAALRLIGLGWTFKVSRGNRGYCYEKTKVITLPWHALEANPAKPGYSEYYLAHEIAHALAGKKAAHGMVFMEHLKALCPPEHIHYETNYKPRNAKMAGIKGKLVDLRQDFISGAE